MRLCLFLLTCFCLLAWSPVPARCRDKPADEPKDDPGVENVGCLATAYNLVDYGRKTKSPEALITAAGILRRMPPAVPLKAQAEDPKQSPPLKDLPSLREEADKLLVEAKEMSKNDAVIVALADIVVNRKLTRGAVGGPQMLCKQIAGSGYDSFNVKFEPGQAVQIVAATDGGSQLQLKVSYKAGKTHVSVGEFTGVVGRAVFVVPSGKQPVGVAIHVKNMSKVPTIYKLITN